MRLTDLNPQWIVPANWSSPELFALGFTFVCPSCEYPVACYFKPSLDPANLRSKYGWPESFPPPRGELQWDRNGESFEALTLAPSINNDAAGCGHWTLTNGELTEAAPHGPRVRRVVCYPPNPAPCTPNQPTK